MSLTIAIIGNTNHTLMEFALEKTMKAVPHDEIVVISNQRIKLSKTYKLYKLPEHFEITDYSYFCVKKLNQYINTDYCMTIQYDGFAANPDRWTDEFLKYDCIGPLISPMHYPMFSTLNKLGTEKSKEILQKKEWRTGGGGFNIKSKKLLELCEKDPRIIGMIPMKDNKWWGCDDLELSYYYDELFEKKNIKFAPVGTTLSFATEITTGYNFSLGFHGWHNTALFLDEDEIIYYIRNLKRSMTQEQIGLFTGFLIGRDFKRAIKEFKDIVND